MTDIKSLKLTRDNLYSSLREAYSNTEGDKDYLSIKRQITELNKEIKSLEELNETKEKTHKRQNNSLTLKYSETLGIKIDRANHGTEVEIQARLKRLESYKTTPDNKLSEKELEQKTADQKWRAGCLLEPISGKNKEAWLSNVQVEAATGQKVIVGTDDLKEFLRTDKELPVTFAYIVCGPKDQNHFVTFQIRNGECGPEVIYVDSNGDLMPEAERATLREKGLPVNYLNKNGDITPEGVAAEAAAQGNLLRVQFDEHNCGLYATHTVNMLKTAAGDPEQIKQGVERVKAISTDPDAHRVSLEEVLTNIAKNPAAEKSIQAGFAARCQERQPERRLSVDRAANAGADFAKVDETKEQTQQTAEAVKQRYGSTTTPGHQL